MILKPIALAFAAATLAACGTVARNGPGAETAAGQCMPTALPAYADLQANPKLPNPFAFLSGAPVQSRWDWSCRRAELAALVQQFELGEKPAVTDERVAATFAADTVQVEVRHAGKAIRFPAKITYPGTGAGPYPAMIGVGMVSLNQQELLKQGVAIISFPNNELGEQRDGSSRGKGKFYELYGSHHPASAMVAWSWGISRFIDALEKTPAARIDVKRLGVTGCSRNGKGAIVASAFDDRIALTIAQESGSGGAAGWRVSNAQRLAGQNVQTLRQIVTENVWFTDSFKQFAESADRLPFDQHSVMSLIAPRGFLVIENTSMEWLGNQSAFINAVAARETWKALGAADAMGVSQIGGHPHCQLPASQFEVVNNFTRKFLLGERTADTQVQETDGSFNQDMAAWVDWTTPSLR